jgi:hypothetical protein
VSYRRLAEELKEAAAAVLTHADQLEGTKLAAAAEKLEGTLSKFTTLLRDQLRGFDPAAVALRDLLESEVARQLLDSKTLKLLAKKATGKALTLKATDAPQDQRKRFLEAVVKLGKVDEAATAVGALLAGASRPAPDPGDREKVLAELWRLGTLGEADLEVEKARLIENPTLLRAMAGFAYVKVTAKSAPKTIFSNLVKFARRVQENTA